MNPVTAEEMGGFVDSVTKNNYRRPGTVARRALEEMVEGCLAAGCSSQEIWGGVADAIHNQVLKLSANRTFFPSQLKPSATDYTELLKEIADTRLVLLDLMHVAGIEEKDVVAQMRRKYDKLTAPGVEFVTDGHTFYMKKPHVKDCPST